ncbi:GNAT family N-acetyltransferase [Leptothrix sp. BB-4]
MDIRKAVPADVDAISALVAGLAHHFLLDPAGQGAERFLESVSPEAIRGHVTAPNFLYLVAVDQSRIVGAASLRDGRHLFHLFVATSHQRQGIARALWNTLRSDAPAGIEAYTVNSSPGAVPVYEGFGFVATGPRTERNGIAYVPMRL